MARKAMNIVDVIAWIEYAREKLLGRHIANIYYDKGEGIVYLKLKGGILVLAEPGRRIHVTIRRQPPSEFKPDPLVVLARKHMRNRRLKSLSLLGGDRIISLTSEGGYSIIVELVPRGIAALTSPEGVILAATRYASLRDRVIKPKEPYTPPPSRGKRLEEITAGDVVEAVERRGRLVPAMVSLLGIPGEVAEEAAFRVGVDKNASSIRMEDAEALLDAVKEIVRESLEGKGYVAVKEGVGVEADPFYPSRLEGEAEIKEYEDFNRALDDYFELMAAAKHATPAGGVEEERERLLASLEKARQQASEYREEAEILRLLAERISSSYTVFTRFLECVRERGAECLDRYGVQGSLERGRLVVNVRGRRVEIPVNVESVDEIIVELYRRAGTLEAKAERAEKMRVEIEEKLRDLAVKARSREIGELYKKRRRYWFESFHYTITRNGFLVIGGRDAGQNELIVRRYLEPHDIFMHADIHGAPAVVVKTRGSTPEEGDLYDAAVIAVAYSRAWKAGVGSVQVFYVPASQVSLSPPSGEYLARGGIMVYGRKNYLKPVPVRIWIGIGVDSDGIPRIIQGSREVVETYSLAYGSLVPGDERRLDTAKALKQELSKLLSRDERAYILAVPDQDLASRIPGKARITSVRRGRGGVIDFRSLTS